MLFRSVGGAQAQGCGGKDRMTATILCRLLPPLAGLSLACATLGRLSFTEPDVTLQEIDVTGVGLTGGTFDLVFDVWNPNDYRLRSTRLEVGIDLEGTHFGDALLDRPLDLSPTKDRKSTRLNSSHSQISYAVFCLKKKKKN